MTSTFIKKLHKKLERQLSSELLASNEDELKRLITMPPESALYQGLKNYLEWVSELPWKKETKDTMDAKIVLKKIGQIHLGRHKLKSRIVEYLAVGTLRKSLKGLVFCFVGPPGVGKANLAFAVAHALGRKLIELNLSELETEEAFRGKTSERQLPTPGKIIEAIKKAGSRNPVILIKCLDRPGVRWFADPINILLNLFDPEKSAEFKDNYLGMPFDLSDVFFIVTAHTLEDVPQILQERLEIFQLNAYTPNEKLKLSRKHLIPLVEKKQGLKSRRVILDTSILRNLIKDYTHEAGVYYLERLLNRIYRHAAFLSVSQKKLKISINEEVIRELLGPRIYYPESRQDIVRPGVVTGLVWTPVGGDIIFIEVSVMPGKGVVLMTGQMGEVMRESAMIALSFARSEAKRFGIELDLSDKDVHIHIPYGAVQKDGPSAGVTILTALYSCFSNKIVPSNLTMTGEISLRGAVFRVGAIKEKVIAAHRAGMKTVILPKQNEADLIEVTDEIRSQLTFKFVDSLDEVLSLALSLKSKGTN
jgi:ATP-dependent Lon protease